MLFLLTFLLIPPTEKGYVEKDNKIVVEKKDTISGDFSVMGKDLEILGYVGGDVAVIGGNLKVKGYVSGNVAVVGGDCIILKGSTIGGDLAVVGGKIEKEKGAKISGEAIMVNLGPLSSPLKLLRFLVKGVHIKEKEEEKIIKKDTTEIEKVQIEKEFEEESGEVTEKRSSVFLGLFKKTFPPLIFLILFFIFVFLVNIVFPGAVRNMEEEFTLNFWKIIGTGLLIQIVYIPVILILMISILGIPFALAVILATPLFLIYGSTPILNLLGKVVLNRVKIEYKSAHIPLFVSFLCFSILTLITTFIFHFNIDNVFYAFLKFLFFSISFLSFYTVFTLAVGVIFFAKLGIREGE